MALRAIADRAALALLHQFDPETAHGLALGALKLGLGPGGGPIAAPRLATELAGLRLPNPLGLAAGFDKNAEALAPLMRAGFGFVEVGAATPFAQRGNPRPRLFRLDADRAVINRFGFNNQGADAIARRLARRPKRGVVGLNLGANKDSPDRTADYAAVLRVAGAHVDFATVNVSSPNTEGLRDLQARSALRAVLEGVLEARAALPKPVPIFVKVAPDLDARALDAIAETALALRLDGIVATNTTLARAGLISRARRETGGLSGAPLFERSTRTLAQLYRRTEGRVPLIGVGGVARAEDAFQKIRAGASAVQLYSGLVFRGLGLVGEILDGLDALLAMKGYNSVAAAVGSGVEEWLDPPRVQRRRPSSAPASRRG